MNVAGKRGLITGFAMVFATLLVTALLGYLNIQRLYEYDRLVDHTHQVVSELRNLLALVADAESGMQGYVITADETYLQPCDSAQVTVPAALARIRRLTIDNSKQQPHVVELEQLIERRMELMNVTLQAARTGGYERGRAEVARGAGYAAMDRLRDKIHVMEREQVALLNKRVGESVVGYWTAVVTSFISAVLGLSLALLGLYLTSRDLKARERRAAELNELYERLEQRVLERTAAISTANAALREEIAERQRAEEAVRQMAEELARSNRELSQFATVASHDLQEPLRKIQAFGDRLLGQAGDELSPKGSGQGSTFTVRLPLGSKSPGERAAGAGGGAASLPEYKILLVDDNHSAAHMMSRLLQKLGQVVYVADSGRAALAQVPSVVPDIIISDVAMPGMSGYELAREIRRLDLPRRPYMVAVTGYGQESDRQEALAAGFDKHLTKPVGVGTLEALLRTRD